MIGESSAVRSLGASDECRNHRPLAAQDHTGDALRIRDGNLRPRGMRCSCVEWGRQVVGVSPESGLFDRAIAKAEGVSHSNVGIARKKWKVDERSATIISASESTESGSRRRRLSRI